MNRIITTLLSVLFIVPVAHGQIDETLRRAAIDTLNYGIVNYITSNATNNDFEKNYKANDTIKDKGARILASITGKVVNEDEAREISAEINDLKNKKFILNNIDILPSYLSHDIFTDNKNMKFADFYTKRFIKEGNSRTDLQANLGKIDREIREMITQHKGSLEGRKDNADTTRKDGNLSDGPGKNDMGIYKWLWLLPAFGLVVLTVIGIRKSNELAGQVKKIKEERAGKKHGQDAQPEVRYDSDIKSIKDRVTNLERSIDDLKIHQARIMESKAGATDDRKETFISPRQANRLYFPVPDREGFFRSSQGLTDLSSVSAYEFTINPQNSQQAGFRLIDTPDVIQNALNSPDSYLLPVCRMNIQPAPGKKIKRIQPGTAELQGGNWMVIEKSYIEFE